MMPTKNIEDFAPFLQILQKYRGTFTNYNNGIELAPVYFDPELNLFQNIHHLYRLVPVLEQYADIFDDDELNPEQNYNAWLDSTLGFIKDISPWFYVVLLNGDPQGAIWASAWVSYGSEHHSVDIGGMAARKVNPLISALAVYRFTDMVFESTSVKIVRAEFFEENKAVKRCMQRVGYSHPEPRRCLRFKQGKEIPGQCLSVTRLEWEQFYAQKEQQ